MAESRTRSGTARLLAAGRRHHRSGHLDSIYAGMQATVYPQQPVGGEHQAEVITVDPVVDAASGTFGVRLALPNPDDRLPAGLRCTVAFSGF